MSDISASFILISVILSTIVLSTIVGNVFVIMAILIDKNLQTTANQLVLSLAVADLMVACLVMPLGAYNDIHQGWYLGKGVCEFWTSADVLCCTASILNLLAIALDRYWAVTNVDYIYRRTRRRVNVMILCAWTVGAIVSLAPIFGWKDPDFAQRVLVEHKCLVSQDVAYQIFATISTFYAPLVLLLALYWRIFQVARKRIRRKNCQKAPAELAPARQVALGTCGQTGEPSAAKSTSQEATLVSTNAPASRDQQQQQQQQQQRSPIGLNYRHHLTREQIQVKPTGEQQTDCTNRLPTVSQLQPTAKSNELNNETDNNKVRRLSLVGRLAGRLATNQRRLKSSVTPEDHCCRRCCCRQAAPIGEPPAAHCDGRDRCCSPMAADGNRPARINHGLRSKYARQDGPPSDQQELGQTARSQPDRAQDKAEIDGSCQMGWPGKQVDVVRALSLANSKQGAEMCSSLSSLSSSDGPDNVKRAGPATPSLSDSSGCKYSGSSCRSSEVSLSSAFPPPMTGSGGSPGHAAEKLSSGGEQSPVIVVAAKPDPSRLADWLDERRADELCATNKSTLIDQGQEEQPQRPNNKSLDLKRKFRALGQLVSFVQTSRQFNSCSSTGSAANSRSPSPPTGKPGAPSGLEPHAEQSAPNEQTRTLQTLDVQKLQAAGDQQAELPPGGALNRRPAADNPIRRRQNMDMKREKKAAQTLAIITGVFVCCWLPFFLNAIIMPICGHSCTPSDLILSILLWLGYLNSLLNPIIYTIFAPDFRRAFRRLLCCWPLLLGPGKH